MSKDNSGKLPFGKSSGFQSKSSGGGGSQKHNHSKQKATSSHHENPTPSVILKRTIATPAAESTSSSRVTFPSKRAIAVAEMLGKSESKKEGTSDSKETAPSEGFGIIISLRSAFGFIQSIYTEDSYYFSEKEFYKGVKIGDFVKYEPKNGPKGLAAQAVHSLSPSSAPVIIREAKGTIQRSHDRHKSNLGLIEVDALSSLAIPEDCKRAIQTRYQGTIPFTYTAILRDSVPKNHFLDRGDYVSFTILGVSGHDFFLAHDIRFLQLKRDRAVTLQMERMLAAGAVREVGVVTAVKNQEYGFIRAQDRKDELYFRLDNIESETEVDVREGTEVEFFVIAEMIRGRLCERAIHLKIIPAGTVQFEVVVDSNLSITVLQEPGLPPADEIPGIGELDSDLNCEVVTNTPEKIIRRVDLWHRCMPEELMVRKGDRLATNIHYYRPEKLFFARNVRVLQFFPLGRDFGQIVTIKEQVFGFIKSEMRKVDLYFKLNQVVGNDGEMLAESEVKKGAYVTFDCTMEEGAKLRAVRVKLATEEEIRRWTNLQEVDDSLVLKRDVLGVVVKGTNKRENNGLIKLPVNVHQEIAELSFLDPIVIQGLEQFLAVQGLTSLELPGLPDGQRKMYLEVIKHRFPQITAEVIVSGNNGGDSFKTLRLKRKTAEELAKAEGGEDEKDNNTVTTARKVLTKEPTISFQKEDYTSEEVTPLMNDMEVLFDVAWDRSKNKKVARNVRLTDEEIVVDPEERKGVIDTIIPGRGGFIRCLKTDEKLFWMAKRSSTEKTSAIVKETTEEGEKETTTEVTDADLAVDSEVTYELRKRGGLRCATNVQALPKGSLAKEEVLSSTVTSLVVSHNEKSNQYEVVVVDYADDPVLALKYVNIHLIGSLLASHSRSTTAAPIITPLVTNSSPETVSASSPIPTAVVEEGEGTKAEEAEKTSSELEEGNGTPNPSTAPSTATTEERVEYKAKYFPPLPRLTIPSQVITASSSETTEELAAVKPGDMVTGKVTMNLSLKRSPIAFSIAEIVGAGNGVKRKGRIQLVKFRLKHQVINQLSPLNAIAASSALGVVTPEQWKRYRLPELDWTEIQEISSEKKVGATPNAVEDPAVAKPVAVTPPPVFGTFYCLHQELMDMNYQSVAQSRANDTIEVGEEVEFWTLPQFPHIALSVTMLPKRDFGFGSKGPGINDKLRPKVPTTNLITMAEGPPKDSEVGFREGWRGIDKEAIAALPWASLLTHLQG